VVRVAASASLKHWRRGAQGTALKVPTNVLISGPKVALDLQLHLHLHLHLHQA